MKKTASKSKAKSNKSKSSAAKTPQAKSKSMPVKGGSAMACDTGMSCSTTGTSGCYRKELGRTLLRLTLGLVLLAHGLLKVHVFTIPGTVGFFESLGLPAEAAYLTIFIEIAGGSALILGIFTRLAALLSLPVLIGSIWAHSLNGWVFSNTGGGWEFPAVLSMLALIVLLQGPGAHAMSCRMCSNSMFCRMARC